MIIKVKVKSIRNPHNPKFFTTFAYEPDDGAVLLKRRGNSYSEKQPHEIIHQRQGHDGRWRYESTGDLVK